MPDLTLEERIINLELAINGLLRATPPQQISEVLEHVDEPLPTPILPFTGDLVNPYTDADQDADKANNEDTFDPVIFGTDRDGLVPGPTSTEVTELEVIRSDGAFAPFHKEIVQATDYTIVAADHRTFFWASGISNRTFTLPEITNVWGGFEILIKSISSSNLPTINRSGTDTIDGATSYSIAENGDFVHLIADGSNTDWRIIGERIQSPP